VAPQDNDSGLDLVQGYDFVGHFDGWLRVGFIRARGL
jgi:hypothetical protein